MASFDEELAKQVAAATKRVHARTAQRRGRIETMLSRGGLARADEPVRVASRIDRLSHYYPDVRPISPSALAAGDSDAMAAAGAVLERIINTPDFVEVRYLEGGVRASRAVGRVDIRDDRGRVVGFGTGSLVAPRILLTNHHVLPDAATASTSQIEFDFEDGIDGMPLQPKLFPLDPTTLFLADEDLDFAIVAVAATPDQLAPYGFNPTIRAEGKAIAGDFVTIVQHPEGQKKQVALRDNRVVDVLDNFLHYEADTEPGSSGSPVFNDQWELVALHHASVPAPEHPELGKIVNEGIRVSRLIASIASQDWTTDQRALLGGLAGSEQVPAVEPVGGPSTETSSRAMDASSAGAPTPATTVTVPFEVTIRVGRTGRGSAVSAAGQEAITIDPDYASRPGFDPQFLGPGPLEAPLPALSEELIAMAAINSLATADPRYVLPYHHYSVVLNKARRLAFFTAVNIDGATSFRLKREDDKWFLDPRVPEEDQTGEAVYSDNPLDRGHLVRRLDPAWGASPDEAKVANDDTFHFTNCSPQHHDFNAGQTLWAGLEDYILENADNLDFRVNVFTGPVLAADDDQYRGIQLPRQFWKVVTMVKQSGELSATAYLLSQEELIKGLEAAPEEFSYGAYRTYQVPVSRVAELTGLSFGSLVDADPLAREEAAIGPREVRRPDQIVL